MLQSPTAEDTPLIERLRSSAGRRALGLGAALLIEALLILLLLSLGSTVGLGDGEPDVTVVDFEATEPSADEPAPEPTQEAAQEFIDAYFAGFPRVRAFIDRTLEEARVTGVVRTMAGRRRLVPNLTSRNFQMRAQAEREAVNMPIQGSAADILKKAMIDLHAELPRRGLKTRMILTVHDELLFESPREEADAAAAIVRDRMENAMALSVPLTVDVGIAENWRDAKP